MPLTPNTRLGPYEILAPLGAGGMGEVYRAKDTRLDRDVAIKVLPERLANDADALARFEREAKAVAALSHPNILAIHDVGHEHGISFVVTELLEGETLRERLRRSAVPWRKAVEHGVAMADGLAAAHAKGIIHRDLKPENIFLTKDGVVKILDFGLARVAPGAAVSAELPADSPTMTLDTRPGTVLGTVNYMSPEQISGRATDARTDIFSFGCVLYEMISGRRAFGGDSVAEITTAILRDEPPTLSNSGQVVPVELERVILRCHEKKPEQRIQSARDLSFALRDLLSDSGPSKRTAAYAGQRMRTMLGVQLAVGVVAVAALLLTLNVGGWRERLFRQPRVGPIRSLAVLPLENLSGVPEQEYFADAMTDAIIDDLAKISALRVTSRTTAMQYKKTQMTLPQIARELGVDGIVEGSAIWAGDRVQVKARLIEGATEKQLWGDKYDRQMRDILSIQSDVARSIADGIQAKLTPAENLLFTGSKPVTPEAYVLYAHGLSIVRGGTKEDCQTALRLFDRAAEIDPKFALAHAGRARAYRELANDYLPPKEAMPQAHAAAMHALALDENLADAHAALGFYRNVYEWNWPGAEAAFRRALELNPSHTEARLGLACYLSAMKRPDEAMAQLDIVQELDPAARYKNEEFGIVSYMSHYFDRTVRDSRAALEEDPQCWAAHQNLGLAQAQLGQFAEAIDHLRQAVRIKKSPLVEAMLGGVLAVAGQHDEAKAILADLKKREERDYVCPYELATIPLGLGEYDEAFIEMDRACDARADCLAWLQVDPRLDPIRDDPRFDHLLRRVGFEPEPPRLVLIDQADKKIMLAVLPFENLSRDPEQDYFSDGLTEEMISQLSRVNPKKLGVIARTSAMHYKNTAKTIDVIGRELGVAYVVEGSVRRAENRVRITTQLIHCSDQTQRWADSFERELKDILALQCDVARAIAQEIKVTLTPQEQARMVEARPTNAEAYQAYLKGRFHLNKLTSDGLKKAVEYFEQATALAPDWPLGYAGLGDAYVAMPEISSMRPSESIPKARAAAVKALEMDESLAEAHVTMALIATSYDWNWPAAEREYERAIALSPNYATAHYWYAFYLVFMGRHDEAIRETNKAKELDPLSLVFGTGVGWVYYLTADLRQAETCLRKTLEFAPDFALGHGGLGNTMFLQGRLAEAITEAREAIRLSNNGPYYAAVLGFLCAKAGRAEEARRILGQFAARSTEAYVAPIHFALVHAGLDDRDRMFEWLERAYQDRGILLPFTLIDPLLADMRSDPRFADLLRRVGLPQNREESNNQ